MHICAIHTGRYVINAVPYETNVGADVPDGTHIVGASIARLLNKRKFELQHK